MINLWSTKYQNYYTVNKDVFLKQLEDLDFPELKYVFKETYQENLLQNSLKILQDKGLIILDGESVNLSDSVEIFREYICYRYNETVYKKMIDNFEVDFDYKMKVLANPSILN